MQSTLLVWLLIASGLFCDLPPGNKLGSQVGKGKHQRTDERICKIIIDTCFSLKNPYIVKIQMWFYYHNIYLFFPLLWNKYI